MSELAILGGPKTCTEPYPAWPVWDERDLQAVTEVVRSGRWGGYPYPGPKTAELASKFADLQGGGYAVPMINGTVTMEVALRTADIGWGDEDDEKDEDGRDDDEAVDGGGQPFLPEDVEHRQAPV